MPPEPEIKQSFIPHHTQRVGKILSVLCETMHLGAAIQSRKQTGTSAALHLKAQQPRGERGGAQAGRSPAPRTVLKAGGSHKASRLPIAQARCGAGSLRAHSPCKNANAVYRKPPSKQKPRARHIPLAPTSDPPQDDSTAGLKSALTDVPLLQAAWPWPRLHPTPQPVWAGDRARAAPGSDGVPQPRSPASQDRAPT